MKMVGLSLIITTVILMPICEGAIPGSYFWRPRLGIDLAIPSTEPAITAYEVNRANIHAGVVVLIDGYDVLTSLLGLLSGLQYASDDETMNPAKGVYYTGTYRWSLRALNLFPQWARGNFAEALAVWHNRFKYMDAEVPDWVRKALPWVPEENWDQELQNLYQFRKFSESSFSPFYRFPSKSFDHFISFIPDQIEEFVFSSVDRDVSRITVENAAEKKALQEALHKELIQTGTKPPLIGK